MARIIVASDICPLPSASGDRKRLAGILRCLGGIHDVQLLCPGAPGTEPLPVSGSGSHDKALGCTWRTVCSADAPADDVLSSLTKELRGSRPKRDMDLLLCFGHRVAHAVSRLDLRVPTLIDQCLLPNVLSARAARCAGWRLRARWYFSGVAKAEAKRLRQLAHFGTFVLCSEADRSHLLDLGEFSTAVVENFADAPLASKALPVHARGQGPLVLLGPFSSMANSDALTWFADAVMPHLRTQLEGREIVCMGRDATGRGLRSAERAGLRMSGWVEDLGSELARASVFLLPLRIGSGTKTRVLDAGLLGLPVVTTTVGAEGLPLTHGQHALIADKPSDFANAVGEVLRGEHPSMAQELSALVHQNFLEEKVMLAYRRLIDETLGL